MIFTKPVLTALMIFINLLFVLLLERSFRITGSKVKWAFILMILSTMLWIDPLLLFWMTPEMDRATRLVLAGIVFAGITLLTDSLGYFIICLTGLLDEFKRPVFIVYQAAFAASFFFIINGDVVRGVVPGGKGIVLQYGFYHKVLMGLCLSFALRAVWLLRRSYRESTNEVLRLQLKYIFWSKLVGVGAISITNAIVPMITGSSVLSPLAVLEVFVLYSGVLFILMRGEWLYVKRGFRNLLKSAFSASPDNGGALRELAGHLETTLEGKTDRFKKRIRIYRREDDGRLTPVNLYLGSDEDECENLPVPTESNGYIAGLLDCIGLLEMQNLELALNLEKAKRIMLARTGENVEELKLIDGPLNMPDENKQAELINEILHMPDADRIIEYLMVNRASAKTIRDSLLSATTARNGAESDRER